MPTELVQVVHLGDVREPSILPEKASDVESAAVAEDVRLRGASSSYKAADHPGDPITPQDTPFFHFDIVSAVRAAESRLARTPSMTSVGTGKGVDATDVKQ